MTTADVTAPQGAAREPWPPRSLAAVDFFLGERAAVKRAANRLFGRTLAAWEYAGLAGAPDDARVEVGVLRGALYLEVSDAVAAGYRAHYYVRCAAGLPVLVNDGLHIFVRRMQGRGLGWRMLFRQVQNAAALGVCRIETVAGRRCGENGYYTWPRLGFEAALPMHLRGSLPPELSRARTVLDLMDDEQGRRWWRACGATIHAAFVLSLNSRSRATLDRYVVEKQLAQKTILKVVEGCRMLSPDDDARKPVVGGRAAGEMNITPR